MKYCWESFFRRMNHYLNDLARIIPRINEDLCGSKRKRRDPVWVKLLAYFHCGKVSKQYKQMHCPVNSFSVSSAQMTSYVLFCFIWFWDGRVAFRCGLTIILAWYLTQFQVDCQQLKTPFVIIPLMITCGEIKKFHEKETNVKMVFKFLSNWSMNTHDFTQTLTEGNWPCFINFQSKSILPKWAQLLKG